MKAFRLAFNSFLSFIIFFIPAISFAQGSDIEMADTFRQAGKIYVVIAIIAVIMIGLITYLISIDRKVSKMEKRMREQGREKQ